MSGTENYSEKFPIPSVQVSKYPADLAVGFFQILYYKYYKARMPLALPLRADDSLHNVYNVIILPLFNINGIPNCIDNGMLRG